MALPVPVAQAWRGHAGSLPRTAECVRAAASAVGEGERERGGEGERERGSEGEREKGRGYKRPLFIIHARVNVSLIPVLALAPSLPVPTFPYRILLLFLFDLLFLFLTRKLAFRGKSPMLHCFSSSSSSCRRKVRVEVTSLSLHLSQKAAVAGNASGYRKHLPTCSSCMTPRNSAIMPMRDSTAFLGIDKLLAPAAPAGAASSVRGAMGAAFSSFFRGVHDRKHNTPGIWSEVPNLLGGVQKFYCSKCPGTSGTGMMDYVTAPMVKKTTVGAPYHSFEVSRLKRHVEGGKPRQKQKVHAGILAHRSTLAPQDIPFAHPPPQCALYGTPYSSSSEVKCYRTTCPLIPSNRASHSWSICSDFD